MKLLFNKDNAGSKELKDLLTFVDLGIKFDSIKPDIITATNELIRFIGQPTYDAVLAAYENEAPTAAQVHLLFVCRYPIAIRAYSLLAPNNDIAHTGNGRKMRQDEHEKQAFEWMIDRDNAALERRYYRALDDMVHYLDTYSAEWQESNSFKRSHRLFLRTTDDFNEYFPIYSRYVLMRLEPGIRQCEQNEILPRVGKEKFKLLKDQLQSNIALTEEDEILLNLIKEASCYYSLAWAMTRLSVNIFPEGILQSYTSERETTQARMPAKGLEPDAAKQSLRNDAALILERIEKLLTAPPSPEESECEDYKSNPTSNDNYLSL